MFSADVKILSVLSGETTVAQAARKEHVSEQSIGRPKAEFLEEGETASATGQSGPSTRAEQLAAESEDLTQAVVELRVQKKSTEGRLGPSRTSR